MCIRDRIKSAREAGNDGADLQAYTLFLDPINFDRDQVHGSAAGGDADELRLLSTSDTFINLRAHGGSFDFLSTKVGYSRRSTYCCFLRASKCICQPQ